MSETIKPWYGIAEIYLDAEECFLKMALKPSARRTRDAQEAFGFVKEP